MKKALIIEDDMHASNRLIAMLGRIDPDIVVTAVVRSVESAKMRMRRDKFIDIIFMDVQLADGICFEIFADGHIRPACPVIFTTSYDEAVMDFMAKAGLDCLLKPIDPRELSIVYPKRRLSGEDTKFWEKTSRILNELTRQRRIS